MSEATTALAVLVGVFSVFLLPLQLLALRVAALMRPRSEQDWMTAMSYLMLINVAVCAVVAFFVLSLFAPPLYFP